MEFYGDVKFAGDESSLGQLDQGGIKAETDFPTSPQVGRFVFKGTTLFMCVALNGAIPIWIPLTNAIDSFVHSQSTSSATWTITHDLDVATPILQVYDSSVNMIIPDTVIPTSNNVMVVTFSTALTGTAVIMSPLSGLLPSAAAGTTLLAPDPVAFTQAFTAATVIVVNHNLGFYPVVRAFLSTDTEIQPLSIVHNSVFQTTVTFSSAQTGTIRAV